MLKILFASFIAFVLLSAPLFADETYRVFDEKGKVKEYWKEKGDTIEVYNPDWSRKGYIKKRDDRLEFYDKNWNRDGYGENSRVQPEKDDDE